MALISELCNYTVLKSHIESVRNNLLLSEMLAQLFPHFPEPFISERAEGEGKEAHEGE